MQSAAPPAGQGPGASAAAPVPVGERAAEEDQGREPELEPEALCESLAAISIGPVSVAVHQAASVSANVSVTFVHSARQPADAASRVTRSGVGDTQREAAPSGRAYAVWATPRSTEQLVGVHVGPLAWRAIVTRLEHGRYQSGRDRLRGADSLNQAVDLFSAEARRHGVSPTPTVFRWQ